MLSDFFAFAKAYHTRISVQPGFSISLLSFLVTMQGGWVISMESN